MAKSKYLRFGDVLEDLLGKSIGGIKLNNIGQSLVGKINKNTVIKFDIYKRIEADKYLGVRLSIIDKNSTKKVIRYFEFKKYFELSNKSRINGTFTYIWDYKTELSWYNGIPTTIMVNNLKKDIRKALPKNK